MRKRLRLCVVVDGMYFLVPVVSLISSRCVTGRGTEAFQVIEGYLLGQNDQSLLAIAQCCGRGIMPRLETVFGEADDV